jgi:hypothetical protein
MLRVTSIKNLEVVKYIMNNLNTNIRLFYVENVEQPYNMTRLKIFVCLNVGYVVCIKILMYQYSMIYTQ